MVNIDTIIQIYRTLNHIFRNYPSNVGFKSIKTENKTFSLKEVIISYVFYSFDSSQNKYCGKYLGCNC